MAFHSSCKALAESLPATDPFRAIIDFLLAAGVGRKNPQSWPKIESHLRSSGVTEIPSMEKFQVEFLGKTREGDSFIGSSGKGYFIIADASDAEATRRFYQNRIFTEMDRLRRLESLIAIEFPID
jgi:hypothetical protein